MKTHMFLFITCCLLQGAVSADLMDQRVQSLEKNFQSMEKNVKDMASMMRSMWTMMAGKHQMSAQVTQGEELQLNATVEERVTLLEFQVSDLGSDLEALEDEVTILSSGDLNQDQRILELEIDSDGFEDSVESLIATDIFVTQELTSVTQELTSVNENILDLQDRVHAQEVSGAIAFQADIGEYETIPIDSVVLFSIVDLNLGNGFDILTGEFHVPSGGSGLYYFRFGYIINFQVFSDLRIRKNGVEICMAFGDNNASGVNELKNSSCAVVVTLAEGDVIDVYYVSGANDTPFYKSNFPNHLFTGFRIAPQ